MEQTEQSDLRWTTQGNPPVIPVSFGDRWKWHFGTPLPCFSANLFRWLET